jgi:hypothetical protein
MSQNFITNSSQKDLHQQRRAETVEEFNLRIAAIIPAKPEQVPAPKRPRPLKRAITPKPKRRTTRWNWAIQAGASSAWFGTVAVQIPSLDLTRSDAV